MSDQNRLINQSPNSPDPTVKRFFREKVKNALFYKLFVVAAPLTFLFIPMIVQASFFSFITSLFEKAATPPGTVTSSLNSQRIALLEPAVNLDPNPAKGGGNITLQGGVALVAEAGPAGTASDLEYKPQASQISVHVVKEGETLSHVADLYNVSINTIRWANDIQRGDVVHPGEELVILPITGIRHTVKEGETLASISKKYEGDLDEIANYNDLASSASLTVGEQVIIPDGVVAAAPAPKASSGSGVSIPAPTPSATPASSAGFDNPLPGSVKTQGIHGYNGVDLGGVSAGSPVLAAAKGTIIVAKNGGWNGGYGSYVVVQHSGVQTLYAHLNSVSVGVGQAVDAGTKIGGVGSTGRSTGTHLHFEVRGASNPFR